MALDATHKGFILYPDIADIKDYDRNYIPLVRASRSDLK